MSRLITAAKIAAVIATGLMLSQCDKIKIPGLSSTPAKNYDTQVAVTLTPAALAKLTPIKDQVGIHLSYYGLANQAGTAKANAIGQIYLGEGNLSISLTPGVVTVPGNGFDGKDLDDTGGPPMVLFTAESLTPVGVQDGLLECTPARGTIEQFKTKPAQLTCDLAPPSPAS